MNNEHCLSDLDNVHFACVKIEVNKIDDPPFSHSYETDDRITLDDREAEYQLDFSFFDA